MFPEMQHLWLDDFGAGLANFSSLIQAQYDCIKVARELFIFLKKSEEGHQLFPSLVALLLHFCNHVSSNGLKPKKSVAWSCRLEMMRCKGIFFPAPQPFENFSDLKSTL
ncbi:MAG: EAL domain-containing protein [Candidatus Malihini olakiniferum]